jgi:hypothetical protein
MSRRRVADAGNRERPRKHRCSFHSDACRLMIQLNAYRMPKLCRHLRSARYPFAAGQVGPLCTMWQRVVAGSRARRDCCIAGARRTTGIRGRVRGDCAPVGLYRDGPARGRIGSTAIAFDSDRRLGIDVRCVGGCGRRHGWLAGRGDTGLATECPHPGGRCSGAPACANRAQESGMIGRGGPHRRQFGHIRMRLLAMWPGSTHNSG